jgi:hypothetical protein
VFERLFKERGLPSNIRRDNGVPFASAHALFHLSKLAVWWLRLGIGVERIKPGHPQQNGRQVECPAGRWVGCLAGVLGGVVSTAARPNCSINGEARLAGACWWTRTAAESDRADAARLPTACATSAHSRPSTDRRDLG